MTAGPESAASSALAGEPVAPALLPSAVSGAAQGAASSPAPSASGVLQIRTTEQSWVGVVDARGTALLGRTVLPGEAIGFDGPLPLKVRIGNASATALLFRGQPVELSPFTIGNVARLELK